MTGPLAQLLFNELVIAAKKHELNFSADAEALTIRLLQCRARQHRILACFNRSLHQLAQILQPGPSVLIGQGNPAPHFVDVSAWMKVIRFIESPAKLFAEQSANGSFPSS